MATKEYEVVFEDMTQPHEARIEVPMGKSIGSKKLGVHIDQKTIEANLDTLSKGYDKVQELGDRLIKDNDRIDHLIEGVRSSSLSEADKRAQIQLLEDTRTELIDRYQIEVEDARKQLQAEMLEEIEYAVDGSQEAQSQAAEIRSTSFDAGNREGLDNAANAAEKQANEYEKIKAERSAELQQRIDQMNAMHRQMMRQSMSGRN